MALDWRGPEVLRRVAQAAAEGINSTMALCVIDSKQHHPGWQNRTGTLEGSIAISEYAHAEGSLIVGRWGSSDVLYAVYQELGTARMASHAFLRPSADRNYGRLPELIQRALR